MTAGYQIAQVAHAVADFALHRTQQFQDWHQNSQYIIALQAPDATALQRLHSEASGAFDVIPFHEPDLGDALTSVAFVPHESNRAYLAQYPLAGRRTGKVNKHVATLDAPQGVTS